MAGAVSRPDGKLRPAPQTFERKADASNWLANKRAEINRDKWIDPDAGKVTFGVYAATWIKERDLAETTAERYEGILRNHVQPYLGDRRCLRSRNQLFGNGERSCKMPV